MVLVVLCVLPESSVFEMLVPRMAVQGVLVCQVSVLGMLVPGMAVQMILASQVSVHQMTVPSMTVSAILVCQVLLPVDLVMTLPVIAVPLVVLFGLLFLLGCLVVQVYFFPLEYHMVLFLVFSKQNKPKSPINIVAI